MRWLVIIMLLLFCADAGAQSPLIQDPLYQYQRTTEPRVRHEVQVPGWHQKTARMRSIDSAINDLEAQIRLMHDTGYAASLTYQKLAEVFGHTDKGDSVIYCYQRAMALDNANHKISGACHAALASIYLQNKDFKKATDEVNKAIQLNADSASVYHARNTWIWILNNQDKNDEVLNACHNLIGLYPTDPDPYVVIGQIYKDRGKYDSAKIYLQACVRYDKCRTWKSGWGHVHLGEIYLEEGERQKAIKHLEAAIAIRKTHNSVDRARHVLDSAGYTKHFHYGGKEPDWLIAEGEHIRYYFQDTTDITDLTDAYVKQHEETYNALCETFHPVLPKKLTFYVWIDKELAKQVLLRDAGFTNPKRCTAYVHINNTVGYPMIQILSYWGWGSRPKHRTRLINEGVAIAFEHTDRDQFQTARDAVAGSNINSILDLWKNETAADSLVKAAGGAFITWAVQKSTPEQFRDLIKNQTVKSARNIYGKEQFDKMISEFDQLIGLQ